MVAKPNMAKGLIPLPPYESRLIPDDQNTAWDDLGPIKVPVRGFILHRQLGKNWGTDKYFRTMANARQSRSGGLTTFGQSAQGGNILLWNDPFGVPHDPRMRQDANGNWQYPKDGSGAPHHVHENRLPWASGPVSSPYGDGATFVALFGANAVNSCVSWEIDDFYNDPWSDAAFEETALALAHFAHEYGIVWSDFPIVKAERGRSFVMWHQEITIGTGKICPGPVVMNKTSALIARAQQIMKAYQLAGQPDDTPIVIPPAPIYAASVLPEWWSDSLESARPSDAKFGDWNARVLRRNEVALRKTYRRSEPDTDAPESGPPVEQGIKVTTERQLEPIVKGKNTWFMEDAGHYLLASAFNPRVTFTAR